MQEQDAGFPVKSVVALLWFVSLVVIGVVGYLLGMNYKTNPDSGPSPSQVAQNDNITPLPTKATQQANLSPTVSAAAPTIPIEKVCGKTGPSQKKDYLKSYVLKEGDSINSIAEKELGSVSRNSEITTLNDNIKNLSIGSILYLPPDNIKQSTGYIYEVSGKLVKKDNSAWQLTYGASATDLGIWMPAYWFKDISNASEFSVGDCVTILFDNGSQVYNVRKQ